MGGLRYRLKITFWAFLIGALAISGIPPLAGFWSKDDILSSLLTYASSGGGFIFYLLWGIGIITAGLTAFYMFRLFFGIFSGGYRGSAVAEHAGEDEEEFGHSHQLKSDDEVHEFSAIMTVPNDYTVSAVRSWWFHWFIRPLRGRKFTSICNVFESCFYQSGCTNVPITNPVGSLPIEWVSTLISVGIAAGGYFCCLDFVSKGFFYKENPNPLYQFVLHKYYVDEFLIAVVIQPALWIGRTSTRLLERDALDGGSRSLGKLFLGMSNGLRRLQTGYVRNYALAIMLGVVLIIVYYAVKG